MNLRRCKAATVSAGQRVSVWRCMLYELYGCCMLYGLYVLYVLYVLYGCTSA